ncbi:MAG: hypothetical protein HY788_13255 [Deltaproteobacteria bacterium]|nr:hypothetical protein [Deltaproteobacteria bacterium]
MGRGVSADRLTLFISAVGDAVLAKFVELGVHELGPPPAKFCFMVMGSASRSEQTLESDQDNAIIVEDVPDEQADEALGYFLNLGEKVCGWLDRAGYEYCRGGFMAQSPQWRRPLSDWKTYFSDWIFSFEPELQVRFGTFFDFRCAYGEKSLTKELRSHVFQLLERSLGFFRHLSEIATRYTIPLGFFGNVLVESKGGHRGELNVKTAMEPLIFMIRFYAFKHGMEAIRTAERLNLLVERGLFSETKRDGLLQAYNFLTRARIEREIRTLREQGEGSSLHIRPKELSRRDYESLKASLSAIKRLQKDLRAEEL